MFERDGALSGENAVIFHNCPMQVVFTKIEINIKCKMSLISRPNVFNYSLNNDTAIYSYLRSQESRKDDSSIPIHVVAVRL